MTTSTPNSLDEPSPSKGLKKVTKYMSAPSSTNNIDNILIEVRHGRMSNTKAKLAINKTIMEARANEVNLLLVALDNAMKAMPKNDATKWLMFRAVLETRVAELEIATKKYGRADNE